MKEKQQRNRKSKKADIPDGLKDVVAQVYGLIYRAPVSMGYGAHWALKRTEGADLAEATIACLNGSESELARKVMEWVMAMMPVVTLVGLLVMYTGERIRLTQEMFREKERVKNEYGSGNESGGSQDTETSERDSGIVH